MLYRIALALCLAAVVMLGACAKKWGDAPDVPLTLADGSQVQLSSFGGKPLVVNFWAEW